MKNELDKVLESLSNSYESKDYEREDDIKVNSKEDIMDRIKILELDLKEYKMYKDIEGYNFTKKRLEYWNKIANEWRE